MSAIQFYLLIHRNIPQIGYQFLAFPAAEPLKKASSSGITLVFSYYCIIAGDVRILSAPHRLRRWKDPIYSHKTQTRYSVHLIRIIIVAIAQCIPFVVIGGDGFQEFRHSPNFIFYVAHHLFSLHHQRLHGCLTSCVRIPLKGDDCSVFPSYFRPVRDLAGVNLYDFFLRQTFHRVIFIGHKDKRIQCDWLYLQLHLCFFGSLIHHIIFIRDDQ